MNILFFLIPILIYGLIKWYRSKNPKSLKESKTKKQEITKMKGLKQGGFILSFLALAGYGKVKKPKPLIPKGCAIFPFFYNGKDVKIIAHDLKNAWRKFKRYQLGERLSWRNQLLNAV